ncbi:MAG: 30S ribosomal protein S16 [Chloroflexaceae bacterium]|nr:30S ribosomal protein S16 [Chloroflexaceae bacterium]
MVKIRLRRMGKTKQPSYRIVVADSRSPRDGRFIEIIGHYNPVRQPKVLEVKQDRARYWLQVGAQPSETVVNLFKKVNLMDSNGKLLPPEASVDTGVSTVPATPAPTPAALPAPFVETTAPAATEAEADTEATEPAETTA